MRSSSMVVRAVLLVGLGLVGCSKAPAPMKNFKAGIGPGSPENIKLKGGGSKPLGTEPPSPQPPPIQR
jgi:hypothetical protein